VIDPPPRQPIIMPEIMDWPQGEALAEVSRAGQYLREGRLVVLPTESVYMVAASALAPGGLAALDKAIGNETALTLLLGQAAQVYDWLPFFRGVGVRLARRFWPGPLTLASGTGIHQGLLPRLPEPVQKRLAPRRQLRLRLPDHAAARKTALQLDMPLVAAATPWITPEQVATAVGDKVALIIQNGRVPFAQPDTVVEVHGRDWQVLHEGAIPAAEIEDAVPCRIVFVCTGNTCRSPLAEGLCRKLLADRLGFPPAELFQQGFFVQSAGLAAMIGSEATPEAVAVAQEHGVDLSMHGSQPLTIELLLRADRLFAMTAGHLRMLHGVRGVRPRLLAPDGEDVADPIGCAPEVYRDCARQIRSHLEARLPELCEC
jgi:protein-tyrosine-phosphatase/tRNA A37 threonylcarbamoyladenosine synthetase subunit TsaC/SUA5/YrdC